jgi:hypothetical protein
MAASEEIYPESIEGLLAGKQDLQFKLTPKNVRVKLYVTQPKADHVQIMGPNGEVIRCFLNHIALNVMTGLILHISDSGEDVASGEASYLENQGLPYPEIDVDFEPEQRVIDRLETICSGILTVAGGVVKNDVFVPEDWTTADEI